MRARMEKLSLEINRTQGKAIDNVSYNRLNKRPTTLEEGDWKAIRPWCCASLHGIKCSPNFFARKSQDQLLVVY